MRRIRTAAVLGAGTMGAQIAAHLANAGVPTLLLDVTAEHEARRRLEAAEMLTSATLDTTNALIIVCDLYGEVLRVNPATTVLTSWSSISPLPDGDTLMIAREPTVRPGPTCSSTWFSLYWSALTGAP